MILQMPEERSSTARRGSTRDAAVQLGGIEVRTRLYSTVYTNRTEMIQFSSVVSRSVHDYIVQCITEVQQYSSVVFKSVHNYSVHL